MKRLMRAHESHDSANMKLLVPPCAASRTPWVQRTSSRT